MRRGARLMMASTKNDPHPHGPHVITYSATLDVPEATATLLTDLLIAERRRRGTGRGARAASAREQALLVLRWFREDADMKILARDLTVSVATGYRYLHEGIDVLAAQTPDLHEVLAAGKAAGWTHVTLDGTLITTDRCRATNPETGYDLWFSGKHAEPGGNVQIVGDPTGFRSRSPTCSRARFTTWPLPGPPASSARCTPRPRCWDCRPWPTRATTVLAPASPPRPGAGTCTRTTPPATSSSAAYALPANAASRC